MAIDLSLVSSLPIKLDERRLKLHFSKGLTSSAATYRTLKEITDVLAQPGSKGPERLYVMYRDARLPKHEAIMRKNHLRYDLTVIRSGLIGAEFIKTLGHYHPLLPGLGVSYPEIYEVLHGGAVYLLQKIRSLADPRRITDVVSVEARPGDKVLIPPNYGHVTVNPYKTTAVMADVSADGFEPLYAPYRSLGGAAYHYVLSAGKPTWAANARYFGAPQVRQVVPTELRQFGLRRSRSIYETLVEDPGTFAFLTRPFKFKGLLDNLFRPQP